MSEAVESWSIDTILKKRIIPNGSADEENQEWLKVIYPGLEDHPHHALLRSIANPGYGYGGMLCVDMGTEARANRLLHHLQNTAQFGLIAVSLGYYETLMSCSGSSTSSELTDEDKALAGISPGLIRMSVGYSGSAEQRWAQFERALAACDKDAALNAGHPPLLPSVLSYMSQS
ncbi:Methionine gamma-lyase [Platanthera zijinensis]|uniref:Methionine gamma-lyase n=1 Tax=Platanthera zijinensis TaxID=2320716 RepID=A0AAP0FUJ9_9ASPA